MPTNTQRITALEALHPAGKHPDYAAKSHSHPELAAASHEHFTPTPPPPVPTPGVTFEDYFDGTALKPHWVSMYGSGVLSDRVQTDFLGNLSQVTVAGGIATIACERKPTPMGLPFASAYPTTYGTFAQKYGTWEARLRYDEVPGVWPSLWLLQEGKKNPYPEVDWLEAYGTPACLGPGNTEHVVYSAQGGPSKYTITPWSPGWHTTKMVWTATAIEFFVDGASTFKVTDPAYVPQVPMYLLAVYGMGVNGNPTCSATASTPDRSVMQIDYVKVWAP